MTLSNAKMLYIGDMTLTFGKINLKDKLLCKVLGLSSKMPYFISHQNVTDSWTGPQKGKVYRRQPIAS
jgi:hypothetical protein